MIAQYGCFEDVCVIIDVCFLCKVSCIACLSFDIEHLFSSQSVLWDTRAIACPLLVNQKIAVMHWSELKPYNKPFVLLHSQDFGLGPNDLVMGTPFAKAACLQ